VELPELQKVWSDLQEKRDDIVFLAVNIGDEAEVINQYWKEEGFTIAPVMQDAAGSVSTAFGVQAYPTNYVIGKDGKIAFRCVGYEEEAILKSLGLEEF